MITFMCVEANIYQATLGSNKNYILSYATETLQAAWRVYIIFPSL